MAKLKGWIFKLSNDGTPMYYGVGNGGCVRGQSSARIFTPAEAKAQHKEYKTIFKDAGNISWGHKNFGKWIAIWEKDNG